MRLRATQGGSLVVGTLVITLAAAGLPAAAVATEDPAPQDFVSTAPAQPVTLITGDTVTLHEGADGSPVVEFTPAPRDAGVPVTYASYGDDEHFYVIPSDVAALVPERLDLSLFDVKALEKLDDEGLPVIVQSTEATDAKADAAEWKALSVDPERTLESIDAVAGEVPAEGAPELIEAVEAVDDVEKVWLDGTVHVLDEISAPQIGAPAAWESGLDGTGAVVAVLDSGVDTSHPDLDEGVVIAEKDFTGSGTATDAAGHGTHVASIVAGTGEASDGANRGIAYGAKLLNGRVLNAEGEGDMSWVIDAMEWAAAQGADVINMSLGERFNYTDGTDPGSMAVNSISERYDTLVVIAAGNDGELGSTTVTTPGTADSALTVGAIDESGVLGTFSSTGPRFGNAGVKPDVTAPGAWILAARAAGTAPSLPAEDRYVHNGGTSMAAPHVAGAAAILKAARPELDGEALKALLVGTAQPTVGDPWKEGAGKVLIPAALGQPLFAEPASLSFGVFASPRAEQAPHTMTIEYTNTGTSDYTLHLSLAASGADGAPVAPGMIALSTEAITVPANGTASVDVTVDPHADDPDLYTGVVTAAGAGFPPVRTVLGFQVEPDMSTLHIEATAPDGSTPLVSSGTAYGIDDPAFAKSFTIKNGVADVRLPRGRFALIGTLADGDPEARYIDSLTMFTNDVDMATDVTLELDGTRATRLVVETEKRAETTNFDQTLLRRLPGWTNPVSFTHTMGKGTLTARVFVTQYLLAGDSLAGDTAVSTTYVASEPVLDLAATSSGGRRDLTFETGYGVLSPTYLGKLSAPVVDAGSGTPEELATAGAKGKVVVVEERPDPLFGSLNPQAEAAADAGAVAVVVYGTTPGPFIEEVPWQALSAGLVTKKALPTLVVSREVGLDLVARSQAKGGARLTGTGIDHPRYQYAFGKVDQGIPESQSYRLDSKNTAAVDTEVKTFKDGETMLEWITMQGSGSYSGFGQQISHPIDDRVIYYSTNPGVTFQHSAQHVSARNGLPSSDFESGQSTFTAGQRASETYLGQVHHGGLKPDPLNPAQASVIRDGETLRVDLPYRVDGDGHAQRVAPDLDSEGRFQLWVEDYPLVDSEYANGTGPVPAQELTYRMRLQTERDTDWWTQSTDVTTEWTFRSAKTDAATILPVLQLDYGVKDLSPLNISDRKVDLDLTVSHQDGSTGSAVGGLKLWASYDDGVTWTAVPVKKGAAAGAYAASFTAPKGVKSVSLRSEAWDAAGGTFKETVLDAIALNR